MRDDPDSLPLSIALLDRRPSSQPLPLLPHLLVGPKSMSAPCHFKS